MYDFSKINLLSSNQQIQLIKSHPYHAFQYIKNPSEEVQMAAINADSANIQYIKNPSDSLQIVAITGNTTIIQYIKHPCREAQLMAIKDNSLEFIKNPDISLFNEHKSDIIKSLLYCLQYMHPNMCKRMIAYLKKHKINWSEINVIKGSVIVDYKNITPEPIAVDDDGNDDYNFDDEF